MPTVEQIKEYDTYHTELEKHYGPATMELADRAMRFSHGLRGLAAGAIKEEKEVVVDALCNDFADLILIACIVCKVHPKDVTAAGDSLREYLHLLISDTPE